MPKRKRKKTLEENVGDPEAETKVYTEQYPKERKFEVSVSTQPITEVGVSYSSVSISKEEYIKLMKPLVAHLMRKKTEEVENREVESYLREMDKWSIKRKIAAILAVIAPEEGLYGIRYEKCVLQRKPYNPSEVIANKAGDCDELCRLFLAAARHIKLEVKEMKLIDVSVERTKKPAEGHTFILQIDKDIWCIDPLHAVHREINLEQEPLKSKLQKVKTKDEREEILMREAVEILRVELKAKSIKIRKTFKSEKEIEEDYNSECSAYFKVQGNNSRKKAEELKKEGKEEEAMRELGDAIKFYTQALVYRSDDGAAYLGLVLCYDERGETDIALNYCKEALAVVTNKKAKKYLEQYLKELEKKIR